MGLCKYCQKEAGFLKNKHPKCEEKYNAAEKIIQNMDNAFSNDPGWQSYNNSARGQWEMKPENLPTSKEELIKKLHEVLTNEEYKILNKVHSDVVKFDIDEFISWNKQPYSILITSLRHLADIKRHDICEKLYPIIDEYINITDIYRKFIYWEGRIEIYWKNMETIDNALANAKQYCQYSIDISKDVSDFIKNELKIPEWLKNHVGYKRMIMILTKEKDFHKILELCEKAKSEGWKGDWDERIEKIKVKINK